MEWKGHTQRERNEEMEENDEDEENVVRNRGLIMYVCMSVRLYDV